MMAETTFRLKNVTITLHQQTSRFKNKDSGFAEIRAKRFPVTDSLRQSSGTAEKLAVYKGWYCLTVLQKLWTLLKPVGHRAFGSSITKKHNRFYQEKRGQRKSINSEHTM
jgi:hypothetical protein